MPHETKGIKIPIKLKLIPWVYCALAITSNIQQTNAQTKPDNLSQLNIGIGYAPVLNFKPAYFDFQPSSFERLSIGVNYLSGYVKWNMFHSYMTSSKHEPTCHLFDNSLAYEYSFQIVPKLYVFAGGQIGLNTIAFIADSIDEDRSFETEISTGLATGIELRLSNRLSISGSYRLMWIFATPQNSISAIDIGLTYYFTPRTKLKEWLE